MKTTMLLSLTMTMTMAAGLAGATEPRGAPPQEAVTACAGLSRGAACAFTGNGLALAGTCEAPPDVETLACRPSGGPGHHGARRGPPQEAVQACASLAADAACSFTLEGEAMTGTCASPPNGSTLACRPGRAPRSEGPGHNGDGPPQEAVTACVSLSANAACSFSLHGEALRGECATPPGSSGLACRPAGPPPSRRGPPQEAVSACASLASGASCSFTLQGRALTGTCFSPPNGSGTLACRPAGMTAPPAR